MKLFDFMQLPTFEVGAVQVDPMKATLKAPGTKRLKLEFDALLSSFAYKFNLRHYIEIASDAAASFREVGLLRSSPGYLKWRSTRLEFKTLSKYTVRFAIQWYNMAIRPSVSQ